MLGDSPCVGHDRERRVGPGGGRERAAVDDEEVVHLVRPTVAVGHRGLGVVAHPGGAVLVRAVAGDLLGVHLGHVLAAGRLEDLAATVDQEAALGEVVLVRGQGDPRDREPPGVDDRVVEVDPVGRAGACRAGPWRPPSSG